MKPEPYTIAFPDTALDDMVQRLRATRLPGDYGNADWQYGVNQDWLQEMLRYWSHDYDWRAAEAQINALPNYRVEIDGIPIHFVHVKGRGPDPRPLILTHGWPWTFLDYAAVIGPLTNPGAHGGDPADAFDVIVPSLPGYTLSSPLRVTGVGPARVAALWAKLMRDALGYDHFFAAGGDWGARVTGELGRSHAEAVRGIYLTMPVLPGVNPQRIPSAAWAEDERWMLVRSAETAPLLTSHLAVHRHDPQTLAYALADSPAGLAAWMWERRRTFSDCDGDVADTFGRDFLCTSASLFWLTNTIGTSMRFYKEAALNALDTVPDDGPQYIAVPTGFGIAPRDVVFMPRSWAAERCNLQRWHVFARGGHYAPAETPGAVIAEYRRFFGPLR